MPTLHTRHSPHPACVTQDSRVLVFGGHATCLLPALLAAGVHDILVASPTAAAADTVRDRYPDPGPLGNTPGVRTWVADVTDASVAPPLPPFLGPFAAAFLVDPDGATPVDASLLARLPLTLAPGGAFLLAYPKGRDHIVDAVVCDGAGRGGTGWV